MPPGGEAMTLLPAIRLKQIEFISVEVSKRTEWTFAEITDVDGITSVVEFTAGDTTREVVTITEALGGKPGPSVPLYANINRSMIADRTPLAFGRMAERAAREGFEIVKCAPFDEVRPPSTPEEILDVASLGIQRVAAVRMAVGPYIQVLVDCHSRFETHTSLLIAEELARLDVAWFEEPVNPMTNARGLARIAAMSPMPVAGGEQGYGETFFRSLLESRSVSIIMPDVKYCGGAGEACRAGKAAEEEGVRISLHSPSGPVSQLASAHVTAAIPGALPLEHAVYEADWRAALMDPPERIEAGHLHFARGNGLGAKLDPETVNRYGRRWKP
jgi:galactonate dehydratase